MGQGMNVKILSSFGTEEDLVMTSRVCTDKSEADITDLPKRIASLIKLQHWAVFEHNSVKIMIEAPIYVMRQWMRHQGAWMEKSRRYTKDEPTFGNPYEPCNDKCESGTGGILRQVLNLKMLVQYCLSI